MSEAHKAVFLSYASQDAEAAKRICEALRQAGVEVWFDQNELRGGDSWDAKIRKQIKECALFVPVISTNTNSRPEGYFRLEWKLAVDRSHLLADDHPFLFPIVIDDTPDATARVPDKFRDVQWTRLRLDETPAELAKRVTRLLSGSAMEAGRPRPADRGEAAESPKKSKPVWLRYAWAAVGITFAFIYAVRQPWRPVASKPAEPARAAITATPSEAQKLVAQARKIYEGSDELDRETLFLADDLVKRALVLDPAEPSAWELGARLSYTMVWQSFDSSEARKADLQRQAARARALAPESVAAQLAVVNAQLAVVFSNFQSASNRQDLAAVERDLLALAGRAPQDYQVQRALGQTYRFLKRPDEALRALQRALELSGGDPGISADVINVLMRRKRYAEAEALIAPALSRRPIGRMLVTDVLFKTVWRGDLAGAQGALATWPGWLLREDRGAFLAWQTWMWSRRPDQALDLAERLQRDYLHDNYFTGPRAVLTARAHEMAGHEAAAQADWRTVVGLADRELAASPDAVSAYFWKAWALSRLGDEAGAQAICTLLQQRNLTTNATFFKTTNLALLWSTMGRTGLAAEHLRAGFRAADDDAYAVTRAMLELDPAYAALRADAHFAELAAAALAPAATASPEPGAPLTPPSSPLPMDSKSVAVLPFENMSADKDNAYFCNGIQEDVLTSLANLHELRVVSRTSVEQYRGTTKTIRQIATELNVAYILEGSVQRAGNKVRVTGQLIRAGTDEHVWAEKFDRDLTDVFGLQSELAQAIAGQLKAAISPREKAVLERRPTENVAAYDLYLKARTLRRHESWGAKLTESVSTLLHQAVELDPRFAEAWAELGDAYAETDFNDNDKSPATREAARAAIDRARELAPDDPVVLGLMGDYYFHANHDYAHATEQYLRLAEIRPNDPQVAFSLGRIQRRQGRWVDALVNLRRANALDPASPEIIAELFALLMDGRRFPEAEALMRQRVKNAPDVLEAGFDLAVAAYCARGSVGEMDEFARKDYGAARASAVISRRKLLARLRGDWAEAVRLDRQLPVDDNYWSSWAQDIAAAVTLAHTGDRAGARARAAATLPAMRAVLQNQPDNSWLHGWLALAYAMTGDKAQAVAHAERSVSVLPESQDAVFGAENSLLAAAALAWVGEKDRALAEFARSLRIPHGAKVVDARNGFTGVATQCSWQPLQDDPRFQALLNDPKNNEPLF
jgi:TolB-like protein/predicted Zn-dependent protease